MTGNVLVFLPLVYMLLVSYPLVGICMCLGTLRGLDALRSKSSNLHGPPSIVCPGASEMDGLHVPSGISQLV